MDSIEFEAFTEELEIAIEMKGKPSPSEGALTTWFRLLQPYSLQNCLSALDKHTASSPFVPTPDSLIKAIISRDGRPTAEEAWATALLSSDENETIVWTDEIAEALSMGAGELLTEGDKTAARMAFRDSYSRLVSQSRESGKPVKVWVSQGHDKQRRNAAIEQAAVRGLLSQDRANELMIEHKQPENKRFLRLVGSAIGEKDKEKRLDNIARLKKFV